MVWDAGTHAEIWSRWTPAVAERLSTDQDWIGEQAIDAQGLPVAWFPRLGQVVLDEGFAASGGPMPVDAKVLITKKPMNEIAMRRWPWFGQLWGAS